MVKIKKKPIIGITPSFDEGDHFIDEGIKRIYLRREYTQILAAVGAVPLLLNPDMTPEDTVKLCDGLIISGGEDINPSFYGMERISTGELIEPEERYHWENTLIEAFSPHNKPILGICYGMQLLNVHYGGTLIQDIPTFVPENVGHLQTDHLIHFSHDFLGMYASTEHTINSRHSQAVDRLAEGFTVCATAPDGIIEAFMGYGHFGMQWHPESDETGAHVYRSFVEHCMRNWID